MRHPNAEVYAEEPRIHVNWGGDSWSRYTIHEAVHLYNSLAEAIEAAKRQRQAMEAAR